MHMDLRKLKIYGGNYDQFMKTRAEQVEAQMKQYNWEQDQIAHMKEYIARFVSFATYFVFCDHNDCQVRSRKR